MPQNTVKAFGPFGFNAANLSAAFVLMSTASGINETPYMASMIVIDNESDQSVAISYNNDQNAIQNVGPTSILPLPFQTNNQPNSHVSLLPKGTTFYIAGSKGTGYIYITIYY